MKHKDHIHVVALMSSLFLKVDYFCLKGGHNTKVRGQSLNSFFMQVKNHVAEDNDVTLSFLLQFFLFFWSVIL